MSLAEGETATVDQVKALVDLDNFDGVYNIADTYANLTGRSATTIALINASESIEVTDAITIAGYEGLTTLYDNVEDWTYSLSDTAANLTDPDNEAIVQGAVSLELSAPITVAEYADVKAAFDDAGIEEFSWDIEDTAAAILADTEVEAITGAEAVSLAEGETVDFDQVAALQELANFDGVYTLEYAVDAFENLLVANALTAEELAILDGAANEEDYTYSLEDSLENFALNAEAINTVYTLTDAADAFENLAVANRLSQAQLDLLNGAENAETYTYSIRDTAANIFDGDEVIAALVDDLELPSAIEVTTATNQAQKDALLAVNDQATFTGGDLGNVFRFTEADAFLTDADSVNVTPEDEYLTNADDTINARTFLEGAVVTDSSTDDNDTLTATITEDITNATALTNIENLEFTVSVAGKNIDFTNITGTDLVTIKGTRDVELAEFVQDGSVEVRLTNNREVTLTGAAAAAATDSYELSVEGSTGENGGFVITAGAGAGAIGEINLTSRGTAENIVAIDSATGNYDGVTELNLMGTADLDVTTDFLATTKIDSEALNANLSLNLKGVDIDGQDVDLDAAITGNVDVLTLTDYVGGADQVIATNISGLNELRLNAPTVADDNVSVKIDDGVDVGIIASSGATGDVTIVVDGAGDDEDSSLNLNIGGAATVTAGAITAAEIQNLNITSSGHKDGNTIGAVTTAQLEVVSVEAIQDFTATSFSMANGTAATYDTFELNLMGAGDINLGTLTNPANINQILVNNEGAGDRAFTINAIGALKTDKEDQDAGVDITGNGTGAVNVQAAAATLTELRVDGTEYTGGEINVVANTAANINAENFSGINSIMLTGDVYDHAISNLGADIDVVATWSGAANTKVEIANATGVTEQTVVLQSDLNAPLTVTALNLGTNITTLNLVTDDENVAAAQNHSVTTLAAGKLEVLNIEAAEDAPFVMGDYTTRALATGTGTFTINTSGAGAVTTGDLKNDSRIEDVHINHDAEGLLTVAKFTGNDTRDNNLHLDGTGNIKFTEIDVSATVDNIVIAANNEGTLEIVTLNIENIENSATITGSTDVNISTALALGADADGISVNLNSDADVTIAAITGNIETNKDITLNSESIDGEGVNTITAPGADILSEDASTLIITGNQELVIGAAASRLTMAAANGDEATLDASAFTGELSVFLTRIDDGGGADVQTINIGTGNTLIDIDDKGDNATHDTYMFVFTDDGIGEVDIVNFSAAAEAGVEGNDVLDFTAFTAETAGTFAEDAGVVTLTFANDAGVITFENDEDGNAVGTSALFNDGSVTLTGVSAAHLAAGNFEGFV